MISSRRHKILQIQMQSTPMIIQSLIMRLMAQQKSRMAVMTHLPPKLRQMGMIRHLMRQVQIRQMPMRKVMMSTVMVAAHLMSHRYLQARKVIKRLVRRQMEVPLSKRLLMARLLRSMAQRLMEKRLKMAQQTIQLKSLWKRSKICQSLRATFVGLVQRCR